MKTTRKSLILVSLTVALMLLLASCNLGDLFPGEDNDTTTTTTATTNPPAAPPIDISKIPESKGLLYQALDDSTCAVFGIGTCRDTVVRIPEVIDGYRVTHVAFYPTNIFGEDNGGVYPLVSTIIIPKTATTITVVAYNGLKSIVVDPENPIYYSEGNCIIEKISKTLVAGCDGSVIPQDVKGIREQAFVFCSNLTSVSIPAGVTSIGDGCFMHCPKLTNVTVNSNNPTYYTKGTCLIEKATETVIAVWGNPVTVPNNVKMISALAFLNIDADTFEINTLDDITFEGTKAVWSNVNFDKEYLDLLEETITVHCTDGDVIIVGGCQHVYIYDCSDRCDLCNKYRETAGPHTYSSDCDEYCDVCGERRKPVADHQLDERSMYPGTCLICGDAMWIETEAFPYQCDSGHLGVTGNCNKTFCDHCGAPISFPHQYSSATDFDCYVCGHIREIED